MSSPGEAATSVLFSAAAYNTVRRLVPGKQQWHLSICEMQETFPRMSFSRSGFPIKTSVAKLAHSPSSEILEREDDALQK